MDLSKSVDFLLCRAGPVIRYRLRREILRDLSKSEEDALLGEICRTPYFRLLESYVKPGGYIGSGAHSWDNWRGRVLHRTPLEDGESAARLLAYYAVPPSHPIVRDFVAAMRDEETLEREFSYIPPETERFRTRFRGFKSGFSLSLVLYAMQAMMGWGDDDYVRPFQDLSLDVFKSILPYASLEEMTRRRGGGGRYSYPYIGEDDAFPGQYHLEILAYTNSWRVPENIRVMADALNHYNILFRGKNPIHVKIGARYYVPFPLNMGNCPVRPFRADLVDSITYRRLLTEIAMLGVGGRVGVIAESAENIAEAIGGDGILRMRFDLPHNKRYSPRGLTYPGAYTDVRLEPDYGAGYSLDCDLTFWAVQFLYLAGEWTPDN